MKADAKSGIDVHACVCEMMGTMQRLLLYGIQG